MRDFLIYTACNKGKTEIELLGPDRLFDVAINDYTESNTYPQEAEYKFSKDEWKYPHIKHNLKDIVFNYKACAFFDEDVKISTLDLNRLFLEGLSLNLNIWQASFTSNSISPWHHLFHKSNSHFRTTNEIEIMMPIFSQSALKKCWETFDLNYSSWGIEIVWYNLLKEKICVIDTVQAAHLRPIKSYDMIMPNGLKPREEVRLALEPYGLKNYTKPDDVFCK